MFNNVNVNVTKYMPLIATEMSKMTDLWLWGVIFQALNTPKLVFFPIPFHDAFGVSISAPLGAFEASVVSPPPNTNSWLRLWYRLVSWSTFTTVLDRWIFTFSAFHILPTIPHSFPQFSIPHFTFRIPRSAIPHFTNTLMKQLFTAVTYWSMTLNTPSAVADNPDTWQSSTRFYSILSLRNLTDN